LSGFGWHLAFIQAKSKQFIVFVIYLENQARIYTKKKFYNQIV